MLRVVSRVLSQLKENAKHFSQTIPEWSPSLSPEELQRSLPRSVYELSFVSPPTRRWSRIESDIPPRPPPTQSSFS